MRPLLANRANVVHGSNRSGSITSVSISSYNIRPQPVALSQTKHDILTVVLDTLPLLQNMQAWYISQPGIDYLTYNSSEGASRMVSYATSKDGVNW